MAMTKVVEDLWFAHLLLTGAPPYESAIDQAERLLRDLPPSGSRDDGLEVVEAARRGDVEARHDLANSLKQARWPLERAEERKEQPSSARRNEKERPNSATSISPRPRSSGST